MNKGVNKRFWENLTTLDFHKIDLENSLVILPIAAIEQHGPHLPVSVDSKIIDGIVNLLVKKLPKKSKAIFLPTQKFGKSNEHLAFPGTLSLSTETLYSTLLDIGSSVSSSGAKKLLLINSHGGNISVLDTVARELRVRHNLIVFTLNWFSLGVPEELYSKDEINHGIHAGDIETSIMLALDPNNVSMERAKNFIPKTKTIEKESKHIGVNFGAKFGWQIQDLNKFGACGNAKIASVEKGKLTLNFVCKKILEVIKEIEAIPFSLISDDTAY